MDHQIAIRDKLAERYLLGELNEVDREDFEEHYFGCAECAEDVRLGTSFVAGVRALLQEEHPRPAAAVGDQTGKRLRWLWRPAPAYALAGALALLLVVERTVLTTGMTPQFVAPVELRPATRGTAQVIRLTGERHLLQLHAGVPVGAAYLCIVTAVDGTMVARIQTPLVEEPVVRLLLPAERLSPGRYRLRIHSTGSPGETFNEEFEFEVQL
jgi:anti-sigma factor RsiW